MPINADEYGLLTTAPAITPSYRSGEPTPLKTLFNVALSDLGRHFEEEWKNHPEAKRYFREMLKSGEFTFKQDDLPILPEKSQKCVERLCKLFSNLKEKGAFESFASEFEVFKAEIMTERSGLRASL